MSKKEKPFGFVAEFKKFIAWGNVLVLTMSGIIVGAFQFIADSLTNDILIPFLRPREIHDLLKGQMQ